MLFKEYTYSVLIVSSFEKFSANIQPLLPETLEVHISHHHSVLSSLDDISLPNRFRVSAFSAVSSQSRL